jgi:hypothetical protein
MERHVVSQAQLNQLAGELHRQGMLHCADWGHRKRVPDDGPPAAAAGPTIVKLVRGLTMGLRAPASACP